MKLALLSKRKRPSLPCGARNRKPVREVTAGSEGGVLPILNTLAETEKELAGPQSLSVGLQLCLVLVLLALDEGSDRS